MSDWISVEDGFPKDEYLLGRVEGYIRPVIVIFLDGEAEDIDLEKGWYLDDKGNFDFTVSVTHWMELPPFPDISESRDRLIVSCPEWFLTSDGKFYKRSSQYVPFDQVPQGVKDRLIINPQPD